MIQERIEHQSGRYEHWRPLVTKMLRLSRANICKTD